MGPLFRHLIRRYFTGASTSLVCLIKFQSNLDLEHWAIYWDWKMRHRCSWALGGQILKCDQNFGRYYFPAPCSLPILFSAAWCNNKCYLDPISPGSRWPGMMIHLSDRPRPISWRCLWVFLSGAEPGQSEYWAGLICLWRWVMWLNITFSILVSNNEVRKCFSVPDW